MVFVEFHFFGSGLTLSGTKVCKFTHAQLLAKKSPYLPKFHSIRDTVRQQDAANAWGHAVSSGPLMCSLTLIGLVFLL